MFRANLREKKLKMLLLGDQAFGERRRLQELLEKARAAKAQ
jgi:hypothetical protein